MVSSMFGVMTPVTWFGAVKVMVAVVMTGRRNMLTVFSELRLMTSGLLNYTVSVQ